MRNARPSELARTLARSLCSLAHFPIFLKSKRGPRQPNYMRAGSGDVRSRIRRHPPDPAPDVAGSGSSGTGLSNTTWFVAALRPP